MEKKDTISKKLPTQSKSVKTTPSFASPNCFKALSETCNSQTESPEARVSICIPPAVSTPMSITTPVTLRMQKPKWEKSLPKKLTIAAAEGISTSLNLKVEIETLILQKGSPLSHFWTPVQQENALTETMPKVKGLTCSS